MSKTPKFCRKCGSALTYSKKRTDFDGDTGEPLYTEKLVCPNRNKPLGILLDVFLTNSHENYENRHGWGWESNRYADTGGMS